jgi:hypothetical protein
VLSARIYRLLARVSYHLVLAALDSDTLLVMNPSPESQWRWQISKHPVVEGKAKARKKACVNNKGHCGVGFSQRSNSAMHRQEAST